MNHILNAVKLLSISCSQNATSMVQQVRSRWVDCRMIRDYKRRQTVVEFADKRMRLLTILRNRVLPVAIREDARTKIMELPRHSTYMHCNYRCAITSRAKGNVYPFRMSRIVWRDLADHNRISGVQRARW